MRKVVQKTAKAKVQRYHISLLRKLHSFRSNNMCGPQKSLDRINVPVLLLLAFFIHHGNSIARVHGKKLSCIEFLLYTKRSCFSLWFFLFTRFFRVSATSAKFSVKMQLIHNLYVAKFHCIVINMHISHCLVKQVKMNKSGHRYQRYYSLCFLWKNLSSALSGEIFPLRGQVSLIQVCCNIVKPW